MALQYQAIELELCQSIETGEFAQDDRLPSENELAQRHAVSRMTARRALQELVTKGMAYRVQGKGTFVANLARVGSSIEISNIADEIARRGNSLTTQVLEQGLAVLPAALRRYWDEAVEPLAYCSLIHLENDLPIQWERRYICQDLSAAFLRLDLSACTPSKFLNDHAPLTRANSRISAINADGETANNLQVPEGAACLKIDRVTISQEQTISLVELVYPGSRYCLDADFHNNKKSIKDEK